MQEIRLLILAELVEHATPLHGRKPNIFLRRI
jgi:hypothetical protein